MLLCFERKTCLIYGYPMYDAKECKVVFGYVQISEVSDSPCDEEHFLAFTTNETEQQKLLQFIYGRKIQKYCQYYIGFKSWSRRFIFWDLN